MSQNESEQDSELRRKEVFLALVTAQDAEMSVAQSRKEIAQRFGITEAEVVRIEREGLDNNWPPL
jgi:DNA-directed RNA polymerase specialized sigma subunit